MSPKKGKSGKEKGSPKISIEFFPVRGAIESSQTSSGVVSVFQKGIFEVKAVCEPDAEDDIGFQLTLNLFVTNNSPVDIACFGETTEEAVEFVAPSLSAISKKTVLFDFNNGIENADTGGGIFCSDGSYIGYDGEALVGATEDLLTLTPQNEKLLFGPGADCIFAGTITYQEAK